MFCYLQGHVQCCSDFYVGNTQNTLKRTEKDFKDVSQKVLNDKNSESVAVHFSKTFTQKPSPQQCRKIVSFDILSIVNPIASMKTWVKSCCTQCMKGRIEIINN